MNENDDIKQAIKELEEMSGDDELRRMAELRLKGIRDEHAALSLATKRGIEKGVQQGIEQKQEEIVKKMLKENVDIELIEKVTGLSKESIEEIRKK